MSYKWGGETGWWRKEGKVGLGRGDILPAWKQPDDCFPRSGYQPRSRVPISDGGVHLLSTPPGLLLSMGSHGYGAGGRGMSLHVRSGCVWGSEREDSIRTEAAEHGWMDGRTEEWDVGVGGVFKDNDKDNDKTAT